MDSFAKEIRKNIIHLAHISKGPHVGSALSCADILASLYDGTLKLDPWDERDIFILSKGHAAMALYSALYVSGIIEKATLDSYCQNNGLLPAHLDKFSARGIEVSSGSLGHGFNIGLGMAYGFKKMRSSRHVYALIGDGESQEGSIWEGALFGSRLKLDNFTAIIDFNNLQGYGRSCEICSFSPIIEKWSSFGWHVVEVDGHDSGALKRAYAETSNEKPKIIIAHTVKGKGVSFMEDQLVWHYYIVTDEYRSMAMEELK
ncbi:MAG: transketolase [Dissulfurispiraceae bacterium]|jgi:transketolase|nr:transketolase [Dissulfurispiraceae bacterium]